MESILTSIKKILGIDEDYEQFDPDIIMHINSTFSILKQLGVGPAEGFYITDESAIWEDFLEDRFDIEMVKTYMGQRVKLMFDPPVSSAHLESLNRQIAEFEWRLNVAVD